MHTHAHTRIHSTRSTRSRTCRISCPTATERGTRLSDAYALAAVLQNLPGRAPRPGDTFSEKDYREAMRETPRGAAAGPAGDRADHHQLSFIRRRRCSRVYLRSRCDRSL